MKTFWNILIIAFCVLVILSAFKAVKFFKLPEWLVNYWAFHAITLPPFGIFLAASAQNESTIKHELVHWKQYERMGLLGFYVNYLIGWVKYGYRNNPMEVEAYES